jgi:hypothetical protein
LLYSIVGGTPAYRDGVARGRGPRSSADLGRWVAENVLSRFSPLFREARYLLAEEPDIRDSKDLLVRAGQPGADSARLFLFGSTEPSPALRSGAASGEVHFIGLHDLYG